ncbi:right-handed parallel beta-helix repeat-containing protein [Microbacterium schleiferi]|uniref:Right-handed parallel beta-helix repeat-containing protein n=1 Tax=Microbacterium schleiferi TaxID=69362 RepID=A0ABU7VC05_9MICO
MTADRDRPTFTAEERGETSVPVRWLARTIMIIAIGVLVVAVVIVGNIVAGDGMPWTFGPTDAETRPLGSATTETVGSDEPDPAALVDAEDERLRAMSAVSTSGGIVAAPEYNTVVLGARPSAYTVDDLVSAGAASGLDDGTIELTRHIVVRAGAVLNLDLPGETLRMASDSDGFVSLVAWGGALQLTGDADRPLTLVGWDAEGAAPDTTTADGRAYVRARNGTITAANVAFDSLGFWSGRTGGVAVTATDSGTAAGSFSRTIHFGLHTGLFLSGVTGVTVDGAEIINTVENGIAVTNGSSDTVISSTTITRSGASAISMDKRSRNLTVTGCTLTGSQRFGVEADGSALADGPSPEGYGLDHAAGLTITATSVSGNARGGTRAVAIDAAEYVQLSVEEHSTPLELLGPADDVRVADGTLTSTGGVALFIADSVTDAVVTGMTLTGTDGAVSVADAAVTLTDNTVRVSGSGHAVSIDGASTVSASRNALAGVGAGAIASGPRADVAAEGNDESAWTYELEAVKWLNRHPMGWMWALVLVIPAIGVPLIARRNRRHRELRALFEDAVIRFGAAQIESYQQGGAMPISTPRPIEPESAPKTHPPSHRGTAVEPDATTGPEPAPRPQPEPTMPVGPPAMAPANPYIVRVGPTSDAPVTQEGATSEATIPPIHPTAAPVQRVPRPRSFADLRVGPLANREFASLQEFAVAAVLDAGYPLRTVSTLFRIPSWKLQVWVNEAAQSRGRGG